MRLPITAASDDASRTLLPPLFLVLLGAAGYCAAQEVTEKAESRRDEVTISANRYATDPQITGQAQEKPAHDPCVDADHVTVTTRDGVVKVEGTVADVLELLRFR